MKEQEIENLQKNKKISDTLCLGSLGATAFSGLGLFTEHRDWLGVFLISTSFSFYWSYMSIKLEQEIKNLSK